MTKILSPEEMAEDLIRNFDPLSNWFLDSDTKEKITSGRQCALLQVEYMIYLFLGEKSCAPVKGQSLVIDINYWIQVRNKLKEHE